MSEYKKKLKAWELAQKKGDKTVRKPREPKEPVQRMRAGEDRNFLRLAAALKILVGSSVRLDSELPTDEPLRAGGLPRAEELLRDYLLNYSAVCFRTSTHR